MTTTPGRGGRHRFRARRGALGLATLVAAAALGLSACGSSNAHPPAAPSSQAATCPLTGTPPPGGRVPARPAAAVKVENAPVARPQAGLDRADVVYEEPVEGGLTRFIAIYQCQDASRIEPVRSGRLVDPPILSQYGHPLFAFAGGINPVLGKVAASPLVGLDFTKYGAVYHRDPARKAPHNLVTSTAAIYGAGQKAAPNDPPPRPVFTFGPLPGGATPTGSVHLPFSHAVDVAWHWDQGRGRWLRSYQGATPGPAKLMDGTQIQAANVVVQQVVLHPSPYVEDPTGIHENVFPLTGSGPATVYRNGAAIRGTWSRPSLGDVTTFRNAAGKPIPLAPGPTWVELVPAKVLAGH